MEKISIPLLTISIGVVIILIYFGASVILPVLLATFLFFLLDPFVMRLERRKVPRAVGSAFAVFVSVCLILGTGFAFYSSLRKVAEKVPAYSEKISGVTKSVFGVVNRIFETTERFVEGKTGPADPRPPEEARPAPSSHAMTPYLMRGVSSLLSLIGWSFFIPLITLFFLLEKAELSLRIEPLIGDHLRYEIICDEMREMSHGFFVGNFVVFVTMTAAFNAAFFAMKLEGAFQLALFAGLLNLIPVFGAVLGAILPAAQAFLQFDGFGSVLLVFGISLVVHFIGNDFVMPKFLGNRVNVNASSAMIGFLFWGTIWGAAGLFLAIPLMATLRIFLEASANWKPVADILSKTTTSGLERFRFRGIFRRSSERLQ